MLIRSTSKKYMRIRLKHLIQTDHLDKKIMPSIALHRKVAGIKELCKCLAFRVHYIILILYRFLKAILVYKAPYCWH